MVNYSQALAKAPGHDISTILGTGAASGMEAALIAYTGATLCPCIELISDSLNADAHLDGTVENELRTFMDEQQKHISEQVAG